MEWNAVIYSPISLWSKSQTAMQIQWKYDVWKDLPDLPNARGSLEAQMTGDAHPCDQVCSLQSEWHRQEGLSSLGLHEQRDSCTWKVSKYQRTNNNTTPLQQTLWDHNECCIKWSWYSEHRNTLHEYNGWRSKHDIYHSRIFVVCRIPPHSCLHVLNNTNQIPVLPEVFLKTWIYNTWVLVT